MLSSSNSYVLTVAPEGFANICKDANIQFGLLPSQPGTAANDLHDIEYISWSL